uniref:Uncharacterized protein n=1 Tax=Elaeophora elaphi TaxID=1147741 RepID=A0A0R3S4L2_9BILA
MMFCAEKSISSSIGSDSRRNSDTMVRFRSSSEVLFWNSVDSLECELNAVIHRGRFSEVEDGRIREGSSGRFTERVLIDRAFFSDKQIRMEISISQLEKRGKMKYTDLETYLAIHRIIYFTLLNAANGDVIGEADVFYSNLIADGKVNLKLRSYDTNTNILFGVSKRSFHPVGVLHVNFYTDNSVMSCSLRSSTECRHRSSVELSSSYSSTDDRCQHLIKNIDDEELGFSRPFGNVMLASGRTQAYLLSLLAPTVEVRLRQPSIRSAEPLTNNNFYRCTCTSNNP